MRRSPRQIPPIATRRFGAFTAADAYALGWTESSLRHAVRTGRVERLRAGVFCGPLGTGADAARRRHAAAAVAVQLCAPRAVVSHTSAAVLRGLPVLSLAEVACVTVSPDHTGDLAAAHLHRAALRQGEIRRRGTVRATEPARTVVDIARESGAAAGLVVADAALAAGLTGPAALVRAVERCAGWPGVRAARVVAGLADPRAESPLESVSRLELVDGGVPVPDLQPDLVDLAGNFLGRPDLYWDDVGVVGEADGAGKYRDPGDLYREKRRQDALEDAGLVVVRWGWQDVRTPGRLADLVHRAFARARRRSGPRGWNALPLRSVPRSVAAAP